MASQLSNDAEELRLLYQITVSDLSYFKAQQWSVAYYCFLSDAGLIGVAQLLLPLLLTDKIVLSGLLVAATGAALFVLSESDPHGIGVESLTARLCRDLV